MGKCKDCKGWGFAGLSSYQEGQGFAPEFVPMKPCPTCGGRGHDGGPVPAPAGKR